MNIQHNTHTPIPQKYTKGEVGGERKDWRGEGGNNKKGGRERRREKCWIDGKRRKGEREEEEKHWVGRKRRRRRYRRSSFPPHMCDGAQPPIFFLSSSTSIKLRFLFAPPLLLSLASVSADAAQKESWSPQLQGVCVCVCGEE